MIFTLQKKRRTIVSMAKYRYNEIIRGCREIDSSKQGQV